MTVPFAGGPLTQPAEQMGQLGLQGDVVDEQHRQDETCRAEPVNPADIKAEIESGHVDDRRQRDVEQPGAHHDHEPDVEHRMRPSEPQHQEGREAQRPHRRHDADHGGGVVAPAQQRRQDIVPGGDEPGQRRYRDDDGQRAGQDRGADRSADAGAAVFVLQQGIAEHEQRKSAVPDHVQPDRCLRTCVQKPGRSEQARKGQGVNDRRRRGEKVPARQQQKRPRPQDAELRKQKNGRNDVAEGQRRLITRDKCRNRSERDSGKRHGTCEKGRRDADGRKRDRTIAS